MLDLEDTQKLVAWFRRIIFLRQLAQPARYGFQLPGTLQPRWRQYHLDGETTRLLEYFYIAIKRAGDGARNG
jgi:hypothetical protein